MTARRSRFTGLLHALLCGCAVLLAAPALPQAIAGDFLTKQGEEAPPALQKKLETALREHQPKATLVLLVNCVSDRCTDSVRAAQSFLWEPLREESFLLVVVAAKSTKEDVDKLRDGLVNDTTFPMIADPDGEIFESFAKDGVPRAILFDKDGMIVYQHSGWKPGREVEWRVMTEAVLEGRKIPAAASASDMASFRGADTPKDFDPTLYARDIRGKKAPEVPVEEWINKPPDHEGKFLLIDHWATWCGPCVSSLRIAEKEHHKFNGKLVSWAISDEPADEVARFVKQMNLTQPIGVDTQARAKTELHVMGIPHAYVVNPEGIVVWQGHPMSLWGNGAELMQKIIDGYSEAPPEPKE
jgi:peroxiredoxin